MPDGKQSSARKSGRGRRGLAGLARLHNECRRFREEVACIRTFPQLQLRWPSLARLEIGNESSEEDDSAWSVTGAEIPNTLSVGRQTEEDAQVCIEDALELPSPQRASPSMEGKTEGSPIDEKLGGLREIEKTSLEDVQSIENTDEKIEISQGCEDVASKARNDEDEMGSHASDRASELKIVDQIVEPVTAIEETSDPSLHGSLMDRESGQESPKGQTLNTVHTHSGARIAATALFTANPHYNSYELSTDCNAASNFACQSEGFKLPTFPGSNSSDNASHKERDAWRGKVLCSSFESRIGSASERNGYAIVEKRNQTSAAIETDSLEVRGRAFDESSHVLPAHPHKTLHLLGPSCSSYADHEWEDVRTVTGLNGSDFCMAPVHSGSFWTGQEQSDLENFNQNRLAPQTSNCLEDQSMLTAAVGDPSRTAMDVQAVNSQNENSTGNWLTEHGKQKDDNLLTNDSSGGQTLLTTFRSGLAETSVLPSSSPLQNDSHSVFPAESEPHSEALQKRGSGLGLMTLFGMKNFARLGVGSTRDSAMTAQMAMRIKQALERLGNIGAQEIEHRNSSACRNKGRSIDGSSHPIYGIRENTVYGSEENSDGFIGSDLKTFRNRYELPCETRRLESHFFHENVHGGQMLDRAQIDKQGHVESPSLDPLHLAKSATPEDPELYLESVIAALDPTHKSNAEVCTVQTSASADGVQGYQNSPDVVGGDGVMSTNMSRAYVNRTTSTTPGGVFMCHANNNPVVENNIVHSTNVAKPDTLSEAKYCVNDMNSTGELIPHPYHKDEELAAEVNTEDQPAFSVQINAPPGSVFKVEVGGHLTLCNQPEEANHRVLDSALVNPSATIDQQGKFNVRVTHSKPAILQQDSLQSVSLAHQGRPGRLSLCGMSALSDLHVVEEGRETKEASLGTSEVSPPLAAQVDSRSPKLTRTTRFSTQEDLRHSFDRKITSLVKKANQLQEETMLSGNSPHKLLGAGFHHGQLEVTRPKRQPKSLPSAIVSETFVHEDDCHEGEGLHRSINRRDTEKRDAARVNESKVRKAQRPVLMTSLKPKSLDHGASHNAQTAMEAFGVATAGAALELNKLMKDRRSGENMECRAPNKRKVVWASPESFILGPRTTSSQSGMQAAPLKDMQALQQPITNCKSELGAAPLAAEAVNEIRKTKEQQKGPFPKRPKATRYRQPPIKASVHRICSAASASPVAETVRKHVPRQSLKSEQPFPAQKRGGAQVTNVLEASAGETFDYDQFRQELKDLQSERTKLERLVHTIFTNDAEPIEQKYWPPPFSAQEGKTGDVPARHLHKNHEFTMKRSKRGLSPGDGEERGRNGISPNRDSGKKVTGSDSGLHISSDVGSYGAGTNQVSKSFQLPANEGSESEVGRFDSHSLDHISSEDDCKRSPTPKTIVKSKNLQRNQNRASHLTIKHTSEILHRATNGGNGHRIIEGPVSPVDENVKVLSDDSEGIKATIKSHPQVDRKTNQRVGSNVEQDKHRQKCPLASIPSQAALNIDRQGVRDLPDKPQGETNLPVASSGVHLEEQGQLVDGDGKSESAVGLPANLGFSSTDVPQEKFPNLHGILALEDGAVAMESGYATSKLEVGKPDYFKEYLLQALDSSILLLQHCVKQSEELQDPALRNEPESSNVRPSTEVAPEMPEKLIDSDSTVLKCDDRLSGGRAQVNVSGKVYLNGSDRQSAPGHLQHVNAFDSNVQLSQQHDFHLKDGNAANNQQPEARVHPSQSLVSLERTVERGTQVEKAILEIQKMPAHESQESVSKISSSEKETSWSGSLKSVLEAYEEAERSAALLLSSSFEVQKSRGRPTVSCRSEYSDKLPDVEGKKVQKERIRKQKEKFSPLTLLEKAERAEAKELKLRLVHKRSMKSKQNLSSTRGLIEGKEKVQGQLRKHDSGREQWKVPKLIYRTAEFGRKRREEWNDCTEISPDRYAAGWNTDAKGAAQALITKVLNEELMKNQRRQGIKNLRPVKPLKPDTRRKMKASVNLDTYARTVVQMTEREKPLLTKETPPREDKRESNKAQRIQDDFNTEQPSPTLSLERKAKDRVNYFSVNRNLLETENRVLDESTMVFRKTRDRSSGAGDDLTNPDVRESIEHWLDTSGGFEYLDSYNSAGEENIFERQESTNSMKRNANFSITTGVSERNFSDKTCMNKCPKMEARRLSTSRTSVLKGTENGVLGDLVGTSSMSNTDAIQCSSGKNEEFPFGISSYNEDDSVNGLSKYSSPKIEKSSLGGSFGISKGTDQIVREFLPQDPANMDLIYSESHLLYGTDTLDGSTCPSQGDCMPCYFSTAVTSDQQTRELLPRQDAKAGSPKFALNQVLESKVFELTEQEEIELALLEIVLQTILKDDPSSETDATLITEVPISPEKLLSVSLVTGTPCTNTPEYAAPALTEGMTPMSTDDKRLHDQGVQTLVPDRPSMETSSQEHGIGSAKSSGEDWPEYKCLAELESGSQSLEEDEHRPDYTGVDEREADVDLSEGGQIEEFPVDQISTSSTNEEEIDEKSPGRTLQPQVAAVSTRPPYSAVHSMRAAERQPIDFPGIASLAFGYPSPRPPQLKPIGQTSVDRSSVSVQTADMSITQSSPPSSSVFVVPFYCLPPYTMYLPPSPASEAPSQVSPVPMAIPAQHGSQLIASQYASTPTGVVPIFPPPYMFPPSAPFHQGFSQNTVMPVAPIVQNIQQTQGPSSAEAYAQTTVQNPPFPLSSSHPSATEGPSQPSTGNKLAPTSAKDNPSRSRNVSGNATEQAKLLSLFKTERDSLSSSDSCRSSLATPSTIHSSPEHESRVASALAQPRRISGGTSGRVFEEGSSDEAERYGGENVCQSQQTGDVEPFGQTLVLPCRMSMKDEEDPLLMSIIAENSFKQSRIDTSLGLSFLPTANEFLLDEHIGRSDPGTSRSADSARSSVLIASYNGSSSSEGSVKHMRGKAPRKSSGQSSLDGVSQFESISPKPAGRVGFSQTSSRSSGEILGTKGISLQGRDEKQKRFRGDFISRTLPLSEGEVEPGQLPSEGECFGPFYNAWDLHPRLLLSRYTDGQDNILEPGEICKQAFMQLRPPRSELRGGDISGSQSLSEGELRLEILTEPGEVKANRVPEYQGARTSVIFPNDQNQT